MILRINSQCIACDICRLICPEKAVITHDNYYSIDSWACTQCDFCVVTCPTDAIDKIEEIKD